MPIANSSILAQVLPVGILTFLSPLFGHRHGSGVDVAALHSPDGHGANLGPVQTAWRGCCISKSWTE